MNDNLKKKIKIKAEYLDPDFYHDHELPEDEARLRKIFAMHGYELSLDEAEHLWSIRSNDWDASWINMSEDDEIVWKETLKFWTEDKDNLL